jgi:competence ComEA-like helix-hairpin-helix protein
MQADQRGDTRSDERLDAKHVAPRIPFRVYLVGYGVVAALLLYALVFRWVRPVYLDDPVQVESAQVAKVRRGLDPNTATAAELTQLPGIGETLAARIVEYREGHAGGAADGLVFRTPEDLDAVQGIGPKTVQALRPHLRFPKAPQGR